MKKIISLALALVMCLLVFAACSSNNNKLVVGYTLYEPMNYEDADGNLVGFDTELAEAVAEKLGMDIEFKLIDWKNKYLELDSGNINCIWNGFTYNCKDDDGVERADKVDFSVAYMNNEQCVVVKKADAATLTTEESLKDKKGAAEDGSAGEGVVKGFIGEENEKNNYIGCDAQTNTLTELMSGKVDFAVIDMTMAKSLIGKGDYADLEIAPIDITPEKYAVGFKKGSKLTEKVNEALKELSDDGTILELAKKYGVENYVIADLG